MALKHRAMNPAHRPLMPFLATVLAVAFLSLMDATMKSAALAVGVFSASFLRSLMSTGMAAPIWLARGAKWPQPRVLKIHLERGVVSAFMALSFFYSLTKLPIAEAIAISFVAPLIALYFAHLLLGEQISRHAIGASVMGFAGTLVIVWGRLGRADFSEDTALGLLALAFSALLYAYNFVLIRKQAQLAGPAEIATFHGGVSALVHALGAPFLFVMPQVESLGIIVVAAALSVSAAMILAWAYARAEAQVLVPVEYTGFLWAALFGWLFFREPVTTPTIVGVVVIVAALWIAAPRTKKVPATEGANL